MSYRLGGYSRWMAELTQDLMFGLAEMLGDYYKSIPEDYNPDGNYLDITGDGEDEGLYYVPGNGDIELLEKLKEKK